MTTRKTYDTRIKYLVRKGLLPDLYRKQIHRSLISKWKRESPEKYIGYELNDNLEEIYDLMKKVSEDERMLKTLKAFYRITKTLKDVIGTGKEYVAKLKEHKYQIVNAIEKGRKSISLKRSLKLIGISRSTYRIWAMETFYRCGQSITKLCNNSYPQQLTVNEVHKMHRLLSNKNYLHWPIISVAYYGMKKSLLNAHPNTWYKYARLMKIKRKRQRKIKIKYSEGIRAEHPNQKWHADITELKTADGKTSYIYLVVDNYSRYITSWRVSHKICAKTRIDTFKETMINAGLKPCLNLITELIVDGGTENNNKSVETYIENKPLKKSIAGKDILKSNSIVEAINKVLKYNYLFPRNIQNKTQLINVMKNVVIPDYNDKRPHGSLHGLTPLEAYGKRKVNFKKIREKMKEAYVQRIEFNRTHSCLGCPFGCKS